jgi:hypothetical protein
VNWHIIKNSTLDWDDSNLDFWGSVLWLGALQKSIQPALQFIKYYENDVLVAFMPVQEGRYGGLKKIHTPYIMLWSGPFFVTTSTNPTKQFAVKARALEAMLQWVEQHYHFAQLYCDGIDYKLVQARRWQLVAKRTVGCALPASLDKLASHRRRNIKRAQKQLEYTVHTGWQADWDVLLGAFLEQKNIQGISPDCFKQLFMHLCASQAAMAFVAHVPNTSQVVGFRVVLMPPNHNQAVNLFSAFSEQGVQLGASSLLQWAALEHAGQMGYATFDFYGADQPNIRLFKESFAEYAEQRFQIIWFKNKLVRWMYGLKNGFNFL